jgi:hypothetical protein
MKKGQITKKRQKRIDYANMLGVAFRKFLCAEEICIKKFKEKDLKIVERIDLGTGKEWVSMAYFEYNGERKEILVFAPCWACSQKEDFSKMALKETNRLFSKFKKENTGEVKILKKPNET